MGSMHDVRRWYHEMPDCPISRELRSVWFTCRPKVLRTTGMLVGQIPKYRIPAFPVFRYRYNTDTEPVFLRVSVSHTDTGFLVSSVRFGIGTHHWLCDQNYINRTLVLIA